MSTQPIMHRLTQRQNQMESGKRVARPRHAGDQQPTEYPVPAEHAEKAGDASTNSNALVKAGIGKGYVLDHPDDSVGAVHGEVNPSRGAGMYQAIKAPKSGIVASFWKSITHASFNNRGPPPKSFMTW